MSKFFSNDVTLARGVHSSPFQQYLLDTRKNFGKKLLILTISSVPSHTLTDLLQTTKIGDWSVRCRLPKMHSTVRGVIGPVGLDSDLGEFQELLLLSDTTITEVKRLCKGKEKVPTLSAVLTFNTPELPKYVYVYQQRYSVRPFIDRPWQCFRCQNFGHSADQCRFSPRCVLCAGAHLLQECPVRSLSTSGSSTTNKTKCANCKGEHTANYGGCRYMKEAQQVERVRTVQRLSYREALSAVRSTSTASQFRSSQPTTPAFPLVLPSGSVSVEEPCGGLGVSVGTQTQSLPAALVTVETPIPSPTQSSLLTTILTLIVDVLEKAKVIPPDQVLLVHSLLQSGLAAADVLVSPVPVCPISPSVHPLDLVVPSETADVRGVESSHLTATTSLRSQLSKEASHPPLLASQSARKTSSAPLRPSGPKHKSSKSKKN